MSASTKNQALAGVLFLYRDVLQMQIENIDAVRARRGKKIPAVFSVDEVGANSSRDAWPAKTGRDVNVRWWPAIDGGDESAREGH